MKISILGTGYVGLVTAAGFAEKGNNVICVDLVKEKVDMINSGKSPIYENGLEDILKKNIGKNLTATTNTKYAVLNSDITFICVGTPSNPDNSPNLRYVKNVSETIGKILREKETYHVIVVKSTVIPGTTEEIVVPILEENSGKSAGKEFGVVVNPEFLREGVALMDFLEPDRIVIGSLDHRSGDVVEDTYKNFNSKILRTDIKTAEMIKYAANAFLASKISFINEIGNICKELGIDVYEVAKGISLDHRISPYFLNAGLGFGGSCFPKDIKALISKAKRLGYNPSLLNAVIEVNMKQPKRLLNLARMRVGSLNNKRVAVLGLAFKAGTDDTRDSQAFPVIDGLIKEKARIVAYDPEAEENTKRVFGEKIEYAKSAKDALRDSDLALILTDWKEFEELDFSEMKNKVVIDSRNVVKNREGIEYEGLCW